MSEIRNNEPLSKKRPWGWDKATLKPVMRIALPAVIETFFMALVGLVDTLMVSSLGSEAVASVGLTAQPKFIGLALFLAIGVSTSAVVARRYGENRRDSANRTLVTSLSLALVGVVGISVLFYFGADFIIRLCGSSENTHQGAVEYLQIIMGCMVFNCIPLVINSAQRGAGNTKITMVTNITANTINVIFNYLLIGGHFGFPALGIRGAALATVLGTVVSAVMSVLSLIHKDRFLSIPFIIKEKLLPTWQAFCILCKFGYSIFAEQLLLRIGFTLTAVMAAKTGDASMAAHQVAMNILTISFAFGDGLQSAAVALVGRSLGERKPDLAKEYGKTCQLLGGMISIVLALLFFFGADFMMGLFFRKEPHIIEIGRYIVWVMIPIVLFQVRQIIYMGCLRGAGDTLYTAFASTISITVIRSVVSYLCGFVLGWAVIGVWMGILADQLSRYVLAMVRFKNGKWVNIKI